MLKMSENDSKLFIIQTNRKFDLLKNNIDILNLSSKEDKNYVILTNFIEEILPYAIIHSSQLFDGYFRKLYHLLRNKLLALNKKLIKYGKSDFVFDNTNTIRKRLIQNGTIRFNTPMYDLLIDHGVEVVENHILNELEKDNSADNRRELGINRSRLNRLIKRYLKDKHRLIKNINLLKKNDTDIFPIAYYINKYGKEWTTDYICDMINSNVYPKDVDRNVLIARINTWNHFNPDNRLPTITRLIQLGKII